MNTQSLVLDFTDYVSNSVWYNNVTGIQRVQFALANYVVLRQKGRVVSLFEGRVFWMDELIRLASGDPLRLVSSIRECHLSYIRNDRPSKLADITAFGMRVWRRFGRPALEGRMRRSAKTLANECSVFLIVGAFWQYPPILASLREMTRRNVQVIGMCHDIFSLLHRGEDIPRRGSLIPTFFGLVDGMIYQSDYTRSEVERAESLGLLRTPAEARVVHLFDEFPQHARNARIPIPFALGQALKGREYILCVSRDEERKNLARLFLAWQTMCAAARRNLILLVAGRLSPSKTGADLSSIICIPDLSQDMLAALYANCAFTIFPSIEEGWGLPVGESFWFGKACVTSTTTSLPEVGRDLASYADPYSIDAIREGLRELIIESERRRYEKRIRCHRLRTSDDFACEVVDWAISVTGHPRAEWGEGWR